MLVRACQSAAAHRPADRMFPRLPGQGAKSQARRELTMDEFVLWSFVIGLTPLALDLGVRLIKVVSHLLYGTHCGPP